MTSPTSLSESGTKESVDRKQLRRDRFEAIVVLVVALLLFGLMFCIAAIGNGATDNINDYW